MIDVNAGPALHLQAYALEFLAQHPDPVLFCLPVWDEGDADRTIIDFHVGFTNQKATAAFTVIAGQRLSQQAFEPGSGERSFRAVLFNQLRQAMQGGNTSEQHYHHPHTNRYYNLRCSNVNDGVMVLAQDVTAETRALQQARLEAQLLNATSSGLLVLEAVQNSAGEITGFVFVKANHLFARLTGWHDALVGQSYTTLLPETYELFYLKCRVLKTGETLTYRYHYTGNDKNTWLQITLCKLDERSLLATLTDITDTVAWEQEQKRLSDSRLQIIFDTARAGMYTLSPIRDEQGSIIDFRFGLVNQAVASYLGLSAADLAGTLGSVFFPAYKTNGLFDRYVETMQTGNPATFDLHYADGYDNFFTINVVKTGDELFGTFTDHSPLKKLQRELETSIAELKRSNASLEQFAHAASHDLQEPLRKITLCATRLEERHADELTDEAFGQVERIKTAGKRMQRLIKDLLVFAEVGARRPGFEEVVLNLLLQDVLNDLEVAIAEKEAIINIGDLGTLKGDSLHLQQLFQNLISNAIKYSRPDVAPCISITAKQTLGKHTGFSLPEYEAEKAYCAIQLQDNGQGFTNEQAQQIFKIFQRLPQHRNEYTGTGIGLAIVQRVVDNHKGYIKAEGIPGEGATFTMLFPV